MEKCDVLIVGAGPAGVSASFFTKYYNDKLDVILVERLDKRKYFEYHDICGECVSKDLEKDIKPLKIDKNIIVEKVKILEERWPNDLIIRRKINGYIIDRPNFFLNIIKKFEDFGGKFLCKPLLNFEFKDDFIKAKVGDKIIKAKYLIAADGANSLIRKKLNIKGRIATALQYIIDEEPEHGKIIFEYDEKWKGDYKWIFPHGNTTKIGFPLVKFKEKIDNIIKKQARNIGYGGLEKYVYKNILLIGDAACQNNPLTKGGIRPGMVAGKMAAEAIYKNNPQLYDEKWKNSPFGSPIFLKIFKKVKSMNNEELYNHMKPFKKGDIIGFILALFFYRKYLDIYRAYALSNKYGW